MIGQNRIHRSGKKGNIVDKIGISFLNAFIESEGVMGEENLIFF